MLFVFQKIDEEERGLQAAAEAALLQSLGPDSPRRRGHETIAEGGAPKKLKYVCVPMCLRV